MEGIKEKEDFLRIVIKMSFLLDNVVVDGDMTQNEVDILAINMDIMSNELGYTDYVEALHKLG